MSFILTLLYWDFVYIIINYHKSQIMYSYHENTDLIGKIKFHEQININSENWNISEFETKRVFIMHTGGTVGMFPNLQGKFAPVKNQFKKFLENYPYFCDEDQTYFKSIDGYLITPPSIHNHNIWYKFHELDKLIDSTNMTFHQYNFILDQIQKVYDKYDAFVILHGTDTMSYTASAISFMIQNLKKPVVFTGAKIPIGETRNDACNNLLCALTIAGHFSIPEVLIVFDNKILRGNRTNKYSTSSFEFFRTPNFYPLGELGLTVNIKWEKILMYDDELPTKFVKLTQGVQIMRLTPYGFSTPPSSKYIILQSFGDGNIPTSGPIYDWALQNSKLPLDQRKVIINISQVYQSVIKSIYQTGEMANKLGMISGSDMTCEAAMAKLSYLVSKGITDFNQLSEQMKMNLRGQLTEQEERSMKQKQNYSVNSMTLLEKMFQKRSRKDKDLLLNVIHEGIVMQKPSKAAVNRLLQLNFKRSKVYPNNTNILHHLMLQRDLFFENQLQTAVENLLNDEIDVNLVDQQGNSCLFYAILNQHYEAGYRIKEAGGKIITTIETICKSIKEQDIQLLHALIKFQYKFDAVDQEGRNCLFYALIQNREQVINFFRDFSNLFSEEQLLKEDIYGTTMKCYLEEIKKNQQEESL